MSKDARVRIEVEDNGIGISRENQKRLFQEFGRIHPAQSDNLDITGSSGLGLAIVRRIIEMHGGEVGVESELNQGSTFHIEVPAEPHA
jgi:two-component system phosphate regulon sensor histidine kinase PhoR